MPNKYGTWWHWHNGSIVCEKYNNTIYLSTFEDHSKAHELVQQAPHERVSKITKCKKLVNVCLFINKSNLNFTLDLFIKHVEPKNNKKVVHKQACEHRA